jgi:capsular exopolysaccharide synthesis family protein
MTTAPPSRPAPMQQSPRQGPPAPAPAAGPSLDPIKLLKKYQLLLVAMSIVGLIFGVGLHLALSRLAPKYTANVLFECYSPQVSAATFEGVGPNARDEFERFMATQVAFITSDIVLQRVVDDPRLEREAPNWSRQHYKSGSFDKALAVDDLKEKLKARIISGTRLIDMSLSYKDKNDVASVVRLVRITYLAALEQQVTRETQSRIDSLTDTIRASEQRLQTLQNRKRQLIADTKLGSLDDRMNETNSSLLQFREKAAQLTLDLEAVRSMLESYEAQLSSPAGVSYPDDLRAQIDSDPVMGQTRNTLNYLESELRSMQQRGYGPMHREVIAINAQIDSTKAQIEKIRQELLADRFAGLVESTRQAKSSLEAQLFEADTRIQQFLVRLNEITTVVTQISDIDQQINRLVLSIAETQDALANVQGLTSLQSNLRVQAIQTERVPDRMSFPVLFIMVPLGYVLVMGIVGTWIFLREILDQRVKGPADIAMIPRAKLLGMIASTIEDPENPDKPETAFRDHQNSVLAENFRQLRAPLTKKMANAGYKSLVVIGGMPESGATTVVANLASACASTEQRVLIIDANFRRPAIHKVFGKAEGLGLADVLAGEATLESAIQRAERPSDPDVLSVGNAKHRIFERLGTSRMKHLLEEAGKSYDLVLIDVAPAMVSGDGVALANRADASILVVRAMAEKRGLVARLRNELSDSRAEFLGIVINAVRSSAGGYFKRNIKATHEYNAAAAPSK